MLVRMKCPSCQAENDDALKTCAACGKPLKPRRRKRSDDDEPPTPEQEAYQRAAWWTFRAGMWGLVPPAGLVLGPLALYRAAQLSGPEQPGRSLVRWAARVALLCTVTQWAGLALILASFFVPR